MRRKLDKIRVLVIGGAGYIGSHTVKLLQEHGARVTILDNFSTGKKFLVQSNDLVEGDLGDSRLTDGLFSKTSYDAVMHFAAFSIVGESVQNPLKYYRNNVGKTAVLIESMLKYGVKRFVFSSTAAVYGEPEVTPITEEHPLRPKNPYGRSKVMVENMLSDVSAAAGMEYVALRYFNAAGADPSASIGESHEPETHLIPIILQAAGGRREVVKLFGTDYPTPDGTCIRDYIHVNDLADAHILALEALLDGKGSDVYNLGCGKGYSVREVIDMARKVTGKEIRVLEEKRREGDPAVLVASSDKIKKDLGWKPDYDNLETIIETAWRWHGKVR